MKITITKTVECGGQRVTYSATHEEERNLLDPLRCATEETRWRNARIISIAETLIAALRAT